MEHAIFNLAKTSNLKMKECQEFEDVIERSTEGMFPTHLSSRRPGSVIRRHIDHYWCYVSNL